MAESVAHFAVKSIGLSRVNGRKPCSLLDAARHNLREIQAEQGAAGHINPRLTRSNVVLAGPTTAAEVQAMASDLLAQVDTARLKRDHCQAIEAVFSLPPGSTIEPGDYFAQCLQWLRDSLTLPVLSAVLHRDEAATHLHVLMLPIMDGRHVGGAPILRPALKRLRDAFFAVVAGPAGLRRDSAKLRGMVKRWAIDAALRECEGRGLPAALGPLWPVLVAAIERDPAQSLQALGIELQDIRPPVDKPTPETQPITNPIGLERTPIGLQNDGSKHQALSCVGLHQNQPYPMPQKVNETLTELWAVVGCRTHRKPPHLARLSAARAAQQSALTKHPAQRLRPLPISCPKQVNDDGLTRVRDEYAHDLSAWD